MFNVTPLYKHLVFIHFPILYHSGGRRSNLEEGKTRKKKGERPKTKQNPSLSFAVYRQNEVCNCGNLIGSLDRVISQDLPKGKGIAMRVRQEEEDHGWGVRSPEARQITSSPHLFTLRSDLLCLEVSWRPGGLSSCAGMLVLKQFSSTPEEPSANPSTE